MMLVGQLTLGASTSLTVTANEQETVPSLLEAEQVTAFVPTGNALAEGGVHVTTGGGAPATAGAKTTIAEHWPTLLVTTMSSGQVMVGGFATAATGKSAISRTARNRASAFAACKIAQSRRTWAERRVLSGIKTTAHL